MLFFESEVFDDALVRRVGDWQGVLDNLYYWVKTAISAVLSVCTVLYRTVQTETTALMAVLTQ